MSEVARRFVRFVFPTIERRGRGRLRIRFPLLSLLLPGLLAAAVLLVPGGCSTTAPVSPIPRSELNVRVRLHAAQDRVNLAWSRPPLASIAPDGQPRRLDLAPDATHVLTLTPTGWRLGNLDLGRGTLILEPSAVGSLTVNGVRHRGEYRMTPVSATQFDVVNHVNIDDYLKSVVSRELLAGWHDQAYRAQAVAARTYALYEKFAGQKLTPDRHWDLNADERSQVYGGIDSESAKSRAAVDSTAGLVAVHGPPGKQRIFKAYFSSCCGGVSQSAADAFNEPWTEPLSDQNVGDLCSASRYFTWGPIVIPKAEAQRRIARWGEVRNRPERDIALVSRIDIQATNRFGRPVRFLVTDVRGRQYSLGGEELRWALNTDAPEATRLKSSFIEIINDSDSIRIVRGRGWGHGVGMCQWCCEARARAGLRWDEIIRASYPASQIVKAY